MTRRDKYAPDISWEDVSTFVREHERSTGYQASIVLVPNKGYGGGDYVEVRLTLASQMPSATPTIVTRGPFPRGRIGRQMSAVLHLVAQAYTELEAHPWLWAPEKRAEARGELPPP